MPYSLKYPFYSVCDILLVFNQQITSQSEALPLLQSFVLVALYPFLLSPSLCHTSVSQHCCSNCTTASFCCKNTQFYNIKMSKLERVIKIPFLYDPNLNLNESLI
ncbi:hypothetical protein RJT34_13748 [Clitoria ternatea]|uniref:Uncharacterized protein n=1 Tax=Clitoria ternatea TaxID=43366 RepID=A0AAN9JRM5_CLITE